MTGTIVFPEVDPAFDEVTAVLVPADRTSRRPVTSGVRATLWDDQNDRDLPDRLVRNLSGALVLLNRPLGETYTFRSTRPRPATAVRSWWRSNRTRATAARSSGSRADPTRPSIRARR